MTVLTFLASCSSYQPLSAPESTIPSDVTLTDAGDYLLLEPATGSSPYAHGIIFYPGGLVEPEAYISILAPVAIDAPIVILRVPSDLAVFSPRKADVILDGPVAELATEWTLAGHSLGGAMAARFMARWSADYERVRGLILFASYPAGSDSLADTSIPVLSIWAENDGLATEQDRRDTAALLPPDARVEVIAGGNHAGFGEYGPQDDDGERTIPLEEQHRESRALIQEFLAGL